MTITLQPMRAEPSVIGLDLLFLAIVAGAFIGIVVLIVLIRLPKKLSAGNSASPNQTTSPDRNRRSRGKSVWLWLPLALLLVVGAVFAVYGLTPKPDALSPAEFLQAVDSHRIIQAKLYYDTQSPVYTITGTYRKSDAQEHGVPTHFEAKMVLTSTMLEKLTSMPGFQIRSENTILIGWKAVIVLLLALAFLAATGVGIIVVVRSLMKRRAAPPSSISPPSTQPIPRKCPQCGAPLRPDVPEGLCPACLLQRGIATEGGAPPPSQPFNPPPIAELAKLFPQLEILEIIGQGGMGAVYKARQPSLERFVALKILTPRSGSDLDFAGRFTREARALARLSHPNIVGVYDFGTVPQPFGAPNKPETGKMPLLHYFVMEYVDGPNLRQVEQAGKLTPREALQIIPQICAALQFAHDEGIVHRDIKPENVLIDKKGRVKIADFGLAKILGQQADLRLTGARDIMGTPHYMAPEQVEKPQEVDHRADIYSLGVVLYEMLTGELPLGKFDPPSQKVQVDVRLDEVVLRSLAKSPERRYQHVSDIKTDIENIAQRPAEPATQAPGNHFAWAGVDYRSKQTLFGLPLVHIATGNDPLTGKTRVAKGIIAIGGQARGVIAVGGLAMGGIAVGGMALGAISLGGCTVGILSIGGAAIALLLAFGGGALAPIAIGGVVLGYLAFGGLGAGAHVFASNAADPVAQRFFGHWAHALVDHLQLINAIIVAFALGLGVGLPLWVRNRIQKPQRTFFRHWIWIPIGAGVVLVLIAVSNEMKHSATRGGSLELVQTNQPEILMIEQPAVVVETFPASGAVDVAPGTTEIRVRFSKPMEDGSWSWATAWENSAPESVGDPHYLNDGRTCVLKVRLEPGKTYAWWLNSDKFKNFKDRAGRPAIPYLLTFQTQSK